MNDDAIKQGTWLMPIMKPVPIGDEEKAMLILAGYPMPMYCVHTDRVTGVECTHWARMASDERVPTRGNNCLCCLTQSNVMDLNYYRPRSYYDCDGTVING